METSRLPIFRERFVKLRGNLSMSQAQFAEYLGISRPTVGLYEAGARIPDAETLQNIALKCGVSADYLLGITDQPSASADIQTAQKTLGLSPDAINKILCLREYLPQILEILDKILANGKCIETLAMVSGFRNSAAYNLELLQEKLQALKRKDAELAKYQKIFGVLEAKNQAEFLLYRAAKELEALLKETVFEDVFDTIEQIETEKADEQEANDGETE